jgi:hypothetical protein
VLIKNCYEAFLSYKFNLLPSLMLQNALDLNVPCQPKCSKALSLSYTFKFLLKKMQSFCLCSRALNGSGKGLIFVSLEMREQNIELRIIGLCRDDYSALN